MTERISDASGSPGDSVPGRCTTAGHDPLTELPCLGTFCREIEAGIDAGGASGQRVAVLLLGVNDFKDVNIGFGHDAGDTILAHLAARVASLRSSGRRLARAGGDVFAVLASLLPSEPETVQDLVSQLAAVLAEPFPVADGVQVQLSAGIGVAVSSVDAPSAAVLLRNAEIAMYRAKSELQAWALYDAALDEQATDRLLYVAQLRKAIATGQLEVHYQPVVDMTTGQPSSMEALVRWRHPQRGLVWPEEFIGLAEQRGLISELTEFVVSTVAEQTRVWQSAGRSWPCAINVSVHCLVDPGCSERLVTALTALAGAVTVEVTESVLADERAVAVLERLAAGGVPCAVDDFGTGYSCLASLKDLPVTTVKIDRAFITDIEVDDRALAVVQAILELAKALGLDVIAEGIQTAATAARLREAGVTLAQGFWFALPMPARELDTWLARRPRPAAAAAAGGDVSRDGDTHSEHVAFFFDDDKELLRELTAYVSKDLSGQGHSVVIAPAGHRQALYAGLPPHRLERAEREGRFLALDAEQTLAQFLRGGVPDPALFEQSLGNLVRAHLSGTGVLRVFDEMGALLWKQGNVVGALQLEKLWNGRKRGNFFLFCAYPLADAQRPPGDGLTQICRRHTLIRMGRPPGIDADPSVETLQLLLDSTRMLLRVDSAEQTVGVLIRAVADLGGTTVPARQASASAIPIDVSLGVADPLLPVAPLGGHARRNLERLLPGLVEDAKVAARNAGRLGRLSEQVDTDPLTGLGNRRGLSRIRGLTGTDSIALIDLDHFKRVNDTYGHDDGDRVLVAFSRALRRHLRANDWVFRLGGEEFLVILAGTAPEQVLVALRNLRRRWQAERPLPVTFSAGVASVDEGDLSAAGRAADAAMYAAKQGGRDRFELASTLDPPASAGDSS